MFGTTTFIYYDNNNQIKNVKRINNIDKKLNYEKFNVYIDNSFEEAYMNFYKEDNATYYDLYNNQNQKIDTKDFLLAYQGDLKINVNSSKIETQMTDEEKEKMIKILKSHSINEDISLFSKQVLDIDNDSKNETIYSLSNFGGQVNETFYSYIFIEESNKEIIDIDLIESQNKNTPEIPQKYHAWSIDLDNDNNYEIVLSSVTGDDTPVYYEFYKYDSSNKTITEMLK